MEAALRVFEEVGSRGATTRRIAAEAGVNEITLFRHFGSKSALLMEAIGSVASSQPENRLPEEPVDPEAELTAWSRAHMAHVSRSSALIRTCMSEMEQAPEFKTCAGACPRQASVELETYLQRLKDRGLADPEMDASAATALLMGALFGDVMGREVMPERYAYSAEEAPARYVALLLRGIGVAPGTASPTRMDRK